MHQPWRPLSSPGQPLHCAMCNSATDPHLGSSWALCMDAWWQVLLHIFLPTVIWTYSHCAGAGCGHPPRPFPLSPTTQLLALHQLPLQPSHGIHSNVWMHCFKNFVGVFNLWTTTCMTVLAQSAWLQPKYYKASTTFNITDNTFHPLYYHFGLSSYAGVASIIRVCNIRFTPPGPPPSWLIHQTTHQSYGIQFRLPLSLLG